MARNVVTNRILFIAPIADRFVGVGRVDEAEHVLRHHVERFLEEARSNRHIPEHIAAVAADEALRLALASGHAGWVDLALELYTASGNVMPRSVVRSLSEALARVPGVDRGALRAYVTLLRAIRDDLARPELEVQAELECLDVSFERLQTSRTRAQPQPWKA